MIATDKILHFLAGATIGFAVAILAGWIVAAASVLAAGIGKEVYDKYHSTNTVDVYDALATALGGAFALAIFGAKHVV